MSARVRLPAARPRAAWTTFVDGNRAGWSDRSRVAALLVWGAFIVFPVFDAATASAPAPRYVLTLLAALTFTLAYSAQVICWSHGVRSRWQDISLTTTMLAIAVVLTAAVGQSWGFLFSYVAACAAIVAPEADSMLAVLLVAAIAVGVSAASADAAAAAGYGASSLGVGLLLKMMRDLRTRNIELSEARAELARTAVAAERERFARDLHDLLGHSLSVIAIKAELAGRLLPDAPERAGAEIGDLETVARSALREVREAVSGYRRPTLEGELHGARMALAAAGIIAEIEHATETLSPEVEAVLAWAVREGATNVIRHSGAHRCEVRVRGGSAEVELEILDDGRGSGAMSPVHSGGNGLEGLRERAAAVRGQLEAGAAASGGFRLAVAVPLTPGELAS